MCVFDMNGGTMTLQSLTTASNLTAFNFDDPTTGKELLNIPNGGLTVNPNTYITFGKDPTTIGGDYPLIADSVDTITLSDFVLPAAPAGLTYGLINNGTTIDLTVAAVPEPGTLALLGAGLMSLLGIAWRRRKAG